MILYGSSILENTKPTPVLNNINSLILVITMLDLLETKIKMEPFSIYV